MSFVALGSDVKEENKNISESEKMSVFGKEIFGEDFKNGLSDDDDIAARDNLEAQNDEFGEIDFCLDEIGQDNQFESKL